MQQEFEIKNPSKYHYVRVGGIQQKEKHKWTDMLKEDVFNRTLRLFDQPAVTMQRFLEPDEKSEYILDLCFDFDDDDNLENARSDTVKTLNKLREELKLSPGDYKLFFTGNRGFNIVIPAEVLGKGIAYDELKPSALLLKERWKIKSLDESIYGKNKVLRYPNFLNSKSNLYKIILEENELLSLPVHKIRELARHSRKLPKKEFCFNLSFRLKFNEILSEAKENSHQKQLNYTKALIERKSVKIKEIKLEEVPQEIKEKFQFACKYCSFLSYLLEKAEDVGYMLWWLGITTLYRLDGGKKLLHYLSSLAPSEYYKGGERELEYQINYAYKEDLKPPTCKKIQESFSGCFTGCKVKSPADFLTPLKKNEYSRFLCANPYFKKPESKSLENVREKLKKVLEEIRDENDKKIHIVNVEPGVGKTRTAVEVFINEKFTWFAPMHDINLKQAIEYKERIGEKFKVTTTHKKFPQPNKKNCRYFHQMEKFFNANLNYRVGLCSTVCKMRECSYLSEFKKAEDVDQLFIPNYYLTIDNFMQSYGNPKRDFVIIDEDCLTRICYPVRATKDDLESFKNLLEDFCKERGLPPDVQNTANTILGILSFIISEMNLVREKGIYPVFRYLDPEKINLVEPISSNSLQIAFTKYISEKGHFEFTSFFQHIDYLLKQKKKVPLLYEYQKMSGKLLVHFNIYHRLPEGKTVIILSATAKAKVYKKITKKDVVEHKLLLVDHESDIHQIMDGNYPKITVMQRFDAILDKIERIRNKTAYRKDQATLILHKEIEKKNEEKIKLYQHHHFGALRGSTNFEKFELHFIVGSPNVDIPSYFLLAIALNNDEIFADFSNESIERILEMEDVWKVKHRYFKNSILKLAYEVLVTDELLQAIGRSRYITGRKTVYIITNEPILIPGIKREFFHQELQRKKQKRLILKENQILHLAGVQGGKIQLKDVVQSGIYKDRVTAGRMMKELAGKEGWIRKGYNYYCDDCKKLEEYCNIPPSGYYLSN